MDSNQGIVMSSLRAHLLWFRARGTDAARLLKPLRRYRNSRGGHLRKDILGGRHTKHKGTEVGK